MVHITHYFIDIIQVLRASINYSEQPLSSHDSVKYSIEPITLAAAAVGVISSRQFIPDIVLLDSGSQSNLISVKLALLLRLKKKETD